MLSHNLQEGNHPQPISWNIDPRLRRLHFSLRLNRLQLDQTHHALQEGIQYQAYSTLGAQWVYFKGALENDCCSCR